MPKAATQEKQEFGALRAPREYKNFIDGQWVPSSSGKTFENRNPADREDLIGTFQESNADDLNAAVAAADRAFNGWRLTPAPERGNLPIPACWPGSLPSRRHLGELPPPVEICHLPPDAGKLWTYTSDLPDSFELYAIHLPSGENLASSS